MNRTALSPPGVGVGPHAFNRKTATLVACVAALVALATCARGPGTPQLGAPVPDFALTDVDGKTIALRDFRGRVVVLNFWASWCPPCVEEMPSLEKLHRALHGKGLDVVSISVDDELSVIRTFKTTQGLSFPILHDKGARVSHAYETFKYPETYVVDREGKLVMKLIGPQDWVSPMVIHRFVELLGGGGV